MARQKLGWIYAARHLHKSNFAPVAACGALSHLQTPQNTITSSGAARWFLSPFKYIREEYFSITSARSKNIFIWKINLAPCDTLGESANKKSGTHAPACPATLSFYPYVRCVKFRSFSLSTQKFSTTLTSFSQRPVRLMRFFFSRTLHEPLSVSAQCFIFTTHLYTLKSGLLRQWQNPLTSRAGKALEKELLLL